MPLTQPRGELADPGGTWDLSGSEIILAARLRTRLGDGIAPRPSRLRSQASDLESAGSPARSGMLRDRSPLLSLLLPSPPLLASDQSLLLPGCSWSESGYLRIPALPRGWRSSPVPARCHAQVGAFYPSGNLARRLLDGGFQGNPPSRRRLPPPEPIPREPNPRGAAPWRLFTSVR